MICTVWKKDLQIKIAFSDSDHIMLRKCNSKEEFEVCWNTVIALCHGIGAEIKLK